MEIDKGLTEGHLKTSLLFNEIDGFFVEFDLSDGTKLNIPLDKTYADKFNIVLNKGKKDGNIQFYNELLLYRIEDIPKNLDIKAKTAIFEIIIKDMYRNATGKDEH